ncbi:MAG: sugar phosphate isomerase/epimerase [Planctomycetota bacterium]|nr:sugar phosphate isomerase/epimerase [Planctomycetota bacterium]
MAKHLLGSTLWSLAIRDTARALETVSEMGFEAVQFTFLADADLKPRNLVRIRETLRRTGLKVPGGMIGFAGEDYSSIAAIRSTGGFVDAAVFPERLQRCRRWGEAMAGLGIRHVTTHAGFLPEVGDPNYGPVSERLAQVADVLHAAGLTVGLETGQEPARVLLAILTDLGRDFLSVNFDPANFILYGSDDPAAAARTLGPRVSMMHGKDGTPSGQAGETWGEEVPLGTGKVDFAAVLGNLEAGGFKGAIIIEREAGDNRLGDIAAGKMFLESLMARG